MSNEPAKLLEAALSKIVNQRHWIKGTFSRESKRGIITHPSSPSAKCFCASGAMKRGAFELYGDSASIHPHDASMHYARKYLDMALPERVREHGVIEYNDHKRTTHAMVVNLFKRAIKAAKAA